MQQVELIGQAFINDKECGASIDERALAPNCEC